MDYLQRAYRRKYKRASKAKRDDVGALLSRWLGEWPHLHDGWNGRTTKTLTAKCAADKLVQNVQITMTGYWIQYILNACISNEQ